MEKITEKKNLPLARHLLIKRDSKNENTHEQRKKKKTIVTICRFVYQLHVMCSTVYVQQAAELESCEFPTFQIGSLCFAQMGYGRSMLLFHSDRSADYHYLIRLLRNIRSTQSQPRSPMQSTHNEQKKNRLE